MSIIVNETRRILGKEKLEKLSNEILTYIQSNNGRLDSMDIVEVFSDEETALSCAIQGVLVHLQNSGKIVKRYRYRIDAETQTGYKYWHTIDWDFFMTEEMVARAVNDHFTERDDYFDAIMATMEILDLDTI